MEHRPKSLPFSITRLGVISKNTMTEVVRQKFFYILVIFGIVVLLSSLYFSQFSINELDHIKFIKDFGLAAIKIFGTLIAISGTAQLLPLELENRTIYPILAKPVYRTEFLLGKYFGMAALLFLTLLLMTLFFGCILFYTEHQFISMISREEAPIGGIHSQEAIQPIFKQIRDPSLITAIGLIYFQLLIVSSISLFVGIFATSVVFNVITTTMIYFSGYLENIAREMWYGNQTWVSKWISLVITFFIPDLSAFDIIDHVVVGKIIPLIYVTKTIGYGIFYTTTVLIAASLIFHEKEI